MKGNALVFQQSCVLISALKDPSTAWSLSLHFPKVSNQRAVPSSCKDIVGLLSLYSTISSYFGQHLTANLQGREYTILNTLARRKKRPRMDSSALGSAVVTAEEDSFTLSPALAAPYIVPDPQELDTPSQFEHLFDEIHQTLEGGTSHNIYDEVSFFSDDEEDRGMDIQQYLPDPSADEPHQVAGASSGLVPELMQQVAGYPGELRRSLPLDLSNELLVPNREAVFPPIHSPGCTVTIHNLPKNISMRDILPRVRGGEIRTATLINLRSTVCAVITFKEARSAELFVHVSESFSDEVWTFWGEEEDGELRLTTARIAYFPIFDTDKFLNDPIDIPLEPRFSMEVDLATRCIAITKCSFEVIEEIWKALRLSEQLCSPHFANQFEDIWLGAFQRGHDGRVEYATLHIWYTNTNMAVGARQRASGRHWAENVYFEADPCDDPPSVLFFRPWHDTGFAWHNNPNHSLLNVYRAGYIGELFQRWNEISEAVRASYATSWMPMGQHKLLPSEEMAVRCEAGLKTGEFDPVTLICMSTQDYDSDDEGNRGPSRLDTRKIKCRQNTRRKAALLSRNARLTALETLAAKAPSTYLFSPGTPAKMTVVETKYEDETSYPYGVLQETEEIASAEQSRSPELQSNETHIPEDPSEKDAKKDLACAEDKYTSLKKALAKPKYWYTVSLEEFLACNEHQHKTMGTMFYIPPEGHNSLQKYPW